MRFPVIVYENGDICLFSSKEAAAQALEPIDIRNGEYRIFDAKGSLINPSVIEQKYGRNWIEAVELSDDPNGEVCEYELQNLLADFLVRAGLKDKEEVEVLDLSSTLEVFINEVGYTN